MARINPVRQRADNAEDKIRKLTQSLKEEYEKRKKNGSNYASNTGSRSSSGNRERGRKKHNPRTRTVTTREIRIEFVAKIQL